MGFWGFGVLGFEMEDDDLFVEGIGAIIGAATATFSAVASGQIDLPELCVSLKKVIK